MALDGAGERVEMFGALRRGEFPPRRKRRACRRDGRIDITALRVIGRTRLDWTPPAARSPQQGAPKPKERRKVWIDPATGWRDVPVDQDMPMSPTVRKTEPIIRQVFIGRGPDIASDLDFERKLYVIRKRSFNEIRCSTMDGSAYWYVCSLSSRTLVYKGLLLADQIKGFYHDLSHESMVSAFALVHQCRP